jgi:hypothetical protein
MRAFEKQTTTFTGSDWHVYVNSKHEVLLWITKRSEMVGSPVLGYHPIELKKTEEYMVFFLTSPRFQGGVCIYLLDSPLLCSFVIHSTAHTGDFGHSSS